MSLFKKGFGRAILKLKFSYDKPNLNYSYLHPESDSRSKIGSAWNLSLITLPSGIETL